MVATGQELMIQSNGAQCVGVMTK